MCCTIELLSSDLFVENNKDLNLFDSLSKFIKRFKRLWKSQVKINGVFKFASSLVGDVISFYI